MSPLALHFLRRVSVLAMLAAVALFAWTRGRAELGFDAAEHVRAAEGAIAIAREYGADAEVKPFAEAGQQLAAARALLAQGDRRAARSAARRAEQKALEAQRAVLVEKESLRTQSQEIVARVDKQLNELETLYSDTVKTVGRERQAEMLSRMKSTRAAGATLILAHEQGDHRKVVREAARVDAILGAARRDFEAAGRR